MAELTPSLEAPILDKIDPEMILFGAIELKWSKVDGAKSYEIFRDNEPVKNVEGWFPYATVDDGSTTYKDTNFEDGAVYYYAVRAVNDEIYSPLSNNQKIKVKLPPHLVIEPQHVQEGAYYESIHSKPIDKKLWDLARLQLIFEKTFPQRSLDYLKVKVKSLKHDLPEFDGLFKEPTQHEIRERAEKLYYENISDMDLNWRIAEKELILKKLQELVEFENEFR